jgi:hypothetical protein
VTPCSVVVGYHRFKGPCCLHLQDEVNWWQHGPLSQPRWPRLETLLINVSWKTNFSMIGLVDQFTTFLFIPVFHVSIHILEK